MGLHAELYGDPQLAVPLVLLHGFGGSAAAWLKVATVLAAELPVVAYDLPGHGRSLFSRAAGGAGTMARDIAADLRARGIERFHLAGHSMGGAVATLIALRAQERAKSLTLFAPGGFGPVINGLALKRYALAEDAEEMREALRMMNGSGHLVSDEEIENTLERRGLAGAREALRNILDIILIDAEGGRQGTLPVADLAGLAMPVRVVWGERDTVLPVTQAEGLPPNVVVHRVGDAGHMLVDERPADVIRFIRSSIAETT
ncbi:alpha/beta fold hydrolase [Rhizobium puerariae]|uniref:Alpha/beta fold hydrolase n=1 Tax=Rhizobium puerariae TaxID=1585791 RepID=A0ABV6AP15_9HYPH